MNAYQDLELYRLYTQLLAVDGGAIDKIEKIEAEYFRSIFDHVLSSLEEIRTKSEPQWEMPEVTFIRPRDGSPAKDIYVDRRGRIHFGLGFIQDLDLAVMSYTSYLVQNFIFQTAPLMGDAPTLSEVITLGEFPLEALSFYSKHLIPDAVTKDGYDKRPFQSIMEFLQKLSFTDAKPEELPALLSRSLAKNPLDIYAYMRDMDSDVVIQGYLSDDNGPYYMRLHHQLMLNALHFVLAHEIAHVQLEHIHTHPDNEAQSREEEAQSDVWALNLLKNLPGFETRSLLALFGFIQLVYPVEITTRLTHPFSRDRMLILCATVISDPDGEALRADVNAGLSMLTRQLDPLLLRYTWEDGMVEDNMVGVSYYSDVDYTTHLYLYLERAPHQVEIWDGPKENAFLLHLLNLEINIVLRDRIHPARVFRRGVVYYRPGFSPEDWQFDYYEDKTMCRQHVRFIAPPHWWLENPNTLLEITSVGFYSEELPSDDEISPLIYYDFGPSEINLDDYLGDLPEPDKKPGVLETVLMAARYFHELNMFDLGLTCYSWCFNHMGLDMLYSDLINMTVALLQSDKLDDASKVARLALSDNRLFRPWFNYIIARDLFQRGEIQEAMEHTFIEMFAIGEFGEASQDASEFYAVILNHPDDPVMAHMRDFHNSYIQASEFENEGQLTLAVDAYRQAYNSLQEGSQCAEDDYLFLRQFSAEVASSLCQSEGSSYKQVKGMFKDIIGKWPQFTPAYVQLAYIALREGDRDVAHELWKRADEINSFNNQVFKLREYVEELNPDVRLERGDIEDLFPKPE
jgi:tetratricopeptide (TPR) repeat protein